MGVYNRLCNDCQKVDACKYASQIEILDKYPEKFKNTDKITCVDKVTINKAEMENKFGSCPICKCTEVDIKYVGGNGSSKRLYFCKNCRVFRDVNKNFGVQY